MNIRIPKPSELTVSQKVCGAEALAAWRDGHKAPAWAMEHEALWEQAKGKVLSRHGLNDREFWSITAAVYEQLVPVKAKAAMSVCYEEPIHARGVAMTLASGPQAPKEFMFMPAGIHTLRASKGGKPVQLTVNVNPRTAQTLQGSLDALRRERHPQLPFFDKDHEAKEAMAWPQSFSWKESPEPGVYVTVEWSDFGRNLVEGRAYRAFSPSFFPDRDPAVTSFEKPAEIVALDFCGGGLVNKPAFRKISPLWCMESDSVEAKGDIICPDCGVPCVHHGDNMEDGDCDCPRCGKSYDKDGKFIAEHVVEKSEETQPTSPDVVASGDSSEEDEDGVWRTVNGRAIFIRDGETVEKAFARSSKGEEKESRNTDREGARMITGKKYRTTSPKAKLTYSDLESILKERGAKVEREYRQQDDSPRWVLKDKHGNTSDMGFKELRKWFSIESDSLKASEPVTAGGDDSYSPPEGVRRAAARGLELRSKWKRGGLSNAEASEQGIGSGVQRASNLKNGSGITLATVKKMHAFFSRHQKNYAPDKKESDGGPTAGTIAWLLWGGSAGKKWADGIVASMDKASTTAAEPITADCGTPEEEVKHHSCPKCSGDLELNADGKVYCPACARAFESDELKSDKVSSGEMGAADNNAVGTPNVGTASSGDQPQTPEAGELAGATVTKMCKACGIDGTVNADGKTICPQCKRELAVEACGTQMKSTVENVAAKEDDAPTCPNCEVEAVKNEAGAWECPSCADELTIGQGEIEQPETEEEDVEAEEADEESKDKTADDKSAVEDSSDEESEGESEEEGEEDSGEDEGDEDESSDEEDVSSDKEEEEPSESSEPSRLLPITCDETRDGNALAIQAAVARALSAHPHYCAKAESTDPLASKVYRWSLHDVVVKASEPWQAILKDTHTDVLLAHDFTIDGNGVSLAHQDASVIHAYDGSKSLFYQDLDVTKVPVMAGAPVGHEFYGNQYTDVAAGAEKNSREAFEASTRAEKTDAAKAKVEHMAAFTQRDIAKDFVRKTHRNAYNAHIVALDAHQSAKRLVPAGSKEERRHREMIARHTDAIHRHAEVVSGRSYILPGETTKKPMVKVQTKKPIGYRIAEIGPGGKEKNVYESPHWKAGEGEATGTRLFYNGMDFFLEDADADSVVLASCASGAKTWMSMARFEELCSSKEILLHANDGGSKETGAFTASTK